MQNYVVIELKSKEEKIKVLNLLAAETEAEYKVTTDLKKFVSEKFNVSWVDNDIRAPTFFQNGPFSNIEDVFPSFDFGKYTVNDQLNITNSQTPTTSGFAQPSVVKVENFLPYSDYVGNMPAHDGLPRSSREKIPIQKAIHEDEQNEQENRIDFLDRNHYKLENGAVESTKTVESSPAQPNAKKRAATEEHENETQKKKRKKQCNICSFVGVFDSYTPKYRHALTHTEVQIYGCFVEGCSFRNKHRNLMKKHMKKDHKTQLTCFGLVELSREENEKVEEAMRECFPLPDTNCKDHCRTCYVDVRGERASGEMSKRHHAQNHVDFMIYKCMEPECHHTGKTIRSMQTHRRAHPDVENPQVGQLPLTAVQRNEIESTFIKCFPEYQTNGGDNN